MKVYKKISTTLTTLEFGMRIEDVEIEAAVSVENRP